jgi:predicted RNA-binding protein with PIN domain
VAPLFERGGAVHIVIDGYNLIKQLFGVSHVPQAKRDQYVDQLIGQAAIRGHRLTIVFDGGEFGFPSSERHNGSEVIYSGYRESADDVIKRYVAQHRNSDMLIVTSDRAIRDFVHNLGVETVSALDFSRLFFESAGRRDDAVEQLSQKPAVKTTTDSDPELDELMESLDVGCVVKRSIDRDNRRSPSQKESKKDRELNRKLRKL